MKLTLPLVLLAFIAAAIVGGFVAGVTATSYRQAYEEEGRVLARTVATGLAFRGRDPRVIQELANGVVAADGAIKAIRIYLVSEGGPRTWVSSVPGEAGRLRPDDADLRPLRTGSGYQLETRLLGEEVLETIEPVRSQGRMVAIVGVYRSLDTLRSRILRQQVALVGIIGVAAILFAAVGALLLRRQVVRRISRLSEAARQVAHGDLSVRLPEGRQPEGRDELDNLARQMDHMIRSVDMRARQQAAVAELGRVVVEGSDLDSLLGEATSLLARHLEVEYAAALELTGDGRELMVRAGFGLRPGTLGGTIPAGHGSQAGFTLDTGKPVVVDDLDTEDRFHPPAAAREHEVRSGVTVIVPGRDRPWGVLAAHSTRLRRFGEEDVLYLEVLAGTLGSAIEWRRAQDRIAAAEAKYRLLVERVPAITYIAEFGADGRWAFVSPQIESVLGYTAEEWQATPDMWYRSLHPDDRDRAIEEERRTFDDGGALASEYRLLAKDGRVVWIRDEAVVQPGEGGPAVMNGVMYDVTSQREAEEAGAEARASFQALVEQVPAVVYVDASDDQSTALYMSPRVEALTGYSVEEWLADGGLWTRSLHPDDRERVLTLSRETNRTGEPFRAEYRLRHRNGSYIWVMDEAILIKTEDGRPLHWQGILYDITERRAGEDDLRQGLEREREVADRLRAIDEMKNAFLAAVSHELRTPLSSVLGYAVTLERPDLDVSDDERRDMTHRLAVNARKLERLLTDLLDLDRLARGILEPHRRPTELADLVRRVIAETDLRGRDVEVTVRPLVAEVDAPKVERIVENLVANAAKHTPDQANIWLKVSPHQDGILVRVDDDGPGIPQKLKAMVFEPFRQASDRGPVSGTGIGLSLVARFAELHGGRAWVEDRPGGGSSFRVYLPCPVVRGGWVAAS
jgi:PAS domain S-box-containing protein